LLAKSLDHEAERCCHIYELILTMSKVEKSGDEVEERKSKSRENMEIAADTAPSNKASMKQAGGKEEERGYY